MTEFQNVSIGQLALMEDMMPEIGGFPSRVLALQEGYDSWVNRLYKDLNCIIKNDIFPTASYRQDDKEDRFNLDISSLLRRMGYQASHDRWSNGHPDIYVESPSKGYKWTGESKIHKDYGYLLDGFKQLCERYSSGFENEDQGAILIITKNIDIKSMMDNWRKLLSSDDDYQQKNTFIYDCAIDKMCFMSSHKHSVTGEQFKVRHIPISIRFAPTDKSARNKK
ncbi:hypothetical protein GNP84_16365 [Aliivibrio fischeri]|uniref:hypothetical protein n=1 Tax=Aliivibrio fischeri TaxID=668 RepID=UPI0012D9B8F4|nr:hypothetical protein [Aliivibrio fischeri]MUK78458.1 hypothetical protein [Aliivibrio fischeri]